MQLRKFGAISAFILTFQFLATLWLLYVAWPQGAPVGWAGLQQLPDSIATYIAEMAGRPTPFLLTNLYNAVFTVPAIVLAVALRQHMAAAPDRMRLAVIGASIAGGLWLAGGIIPVVCVPQIMAANDASAFRAVSGVVIGLILAATTAAGFAAVLAGSAGLSTRRLPRLLSWMLIIGGIIEIVEFTVPVALVLDPALGAIWSFWIGLILLRKDE